MEVPAMVSMMALPREGHFNAVFKMFSFLKSKHNGFSVFDLTKSEIDQTKFPTKYWSATPCA